MAKKKKKKSKNKKVELSNVSSQELFDELMKRLTVAIDYARNEAEEARCREEDLSEVKDQLNNIDAFEL